MTWVGGRATTFNEQVLGRLDPPSLEYLSSNPYGLVQEDAQANRRPD
jgi:hypothetical protein